MGIYLCCFAAYVANMKLPRQKFGDITFFAVPLKIFFVVLSFAAIIATIKCFIRCKSCLLAYGTMSRQVFLQF